MTNEQFPTTHGDEPMQFDPLNPTVHADVSPEAARILREQLQLKPIYAMACGGDDRVKQLYAQANGEDVNAGKFFVPDEKGEFKEP